MGVDINFAAPSLHGLPVVFATRAAGILMRAAGLREQELSLLITGDSGIARINSRWLDRTGPTNVISFAQERGAQGPILGDIVISVDTCRREAEEGGRSISLRFLELLIHGLVHLLGFDHEKGPGEAMAMAAKEKELMKKVLEEKIMADLCINVDHVATIREARGTVEPDPVWAASIVELAGADGVVVHLREDRRHIHDRDVRLLRQTVRSKLTLEMAATGEMIAIAKEIRPDIVTLVPEKREELTTEGGLDVVKLKEEITSAVSQLKDSGIPVSLFIDPEKEQIEASSQTGAECVELHTGRYAEAADSLEEEREFEALLTSARLARDLGLRVHAGHGLTYNNVARLASVPEIEEFSIGHSVIARAVMCGLEKAVRDMNALVKKGFVC